MFAHTLLTWTIRLIKSSYRFRWCTIGACSLISHCNNMSLKCCHTSAALVMLDAGATRHSNTQRVELKQQIYTNLTHLARLARSLDSLICSSFWAWGSTIVLFYYICWSSILSCPRIKALYLFDIDKASLKPFICQQILVKFLCKFVPRLQ